MAIPVAETSVLRCWHSGTALRGFQTLGNIESQNGSTGTTIVSKRKPDKSHHLPSDEDDVVEIEEYDELEQVSEEEVRRVDLMRSRAERQLRRGRLSCGHCRLN